MLHSISQRIEIGILPFHYDFGKQSTQIDSQMDSCVKKIKSDIIDALNSRKRFDTIAVSLISQMFDFRVLTLKWILTKRLDTSDLSRALDTFNTFFSKDHVSSDKHELIDNVNFAIRTNLRVLAKFSQGLQEDYFEKINELESSDVFASMPQNYNVFVAGIYANIPPVESEKVINWVDTSILLEISLLASLFIVEDNLKISSSKLNQVSSFVANTAQEYGASAMELGMLSQKINVFDIENQKLSDEESILLEQGLAEYVLNL
jgi:hypothetical protein